MKNIKIVLMILLVAMVMIGCSTKRQYFEPTQIEKEKVPTQRLSSDINTLSLNGAVLENGEGISKTGLLNSNIKFPKDVTLLNTSGDKFVTSSIDGNLSIINQNGELLFQRSFNEAIVSAALEDNKLALLSAQNAIYLIDISTNEVLLDFQSSDVYAQDARVASPIFMSSLVVFPTLDGKIMIVQKDQGRILRDVVVSSEQFFNNIIFLDVVDETMVAATGKKIVSINPEKTVYYNGEIKDLVIDKDSIYILQKDGTIVLSDLQLQKIKDVNFKFAIFSSAAIFNDSLYVIEKTGYLIKTDLALENAKIYEINSAVEDKIFTGFKGFYYKDYAIKPE
ncbi:MAG: L-seryl-tRNA selenium transferase [Campylobacter sp.]